MDELAKAEARNYITAGGFFLLAVYFLIKLFTAFDLSVIVNETSNQFIFNVVTGVGLILLAILLIILRRRDMIALLFFMFGAFALFVAYTATSGLWAVLFAAFLLLIALITLTGQDKQKWFLFLIPVIWFIYVLLIFCFGINTIVIILCNVILAVLSIYAALACAAERFHLPGSGFLTADENTDFKASGSALGYMLFALPLGGYALYYFSGGTAVTFDSAGTVKLVAAALMILVAILLLAVGKMRFTPIMFILLGLCCFFESCIESTILFYAIGIAELILGLFAIFRKESRILLGIMLLFFSSTSFLSLISVPSSPGNMLASAILNLIPCLIAIYLAFVVYSQRKLPKF